MEKSRKHFLGGGLAGALAILLLIPVVGVVTAYSGAYDIAASSGHAAGVRWFLDTAMRASVRRGADEHRPPRVDAAAGAADYKAMCEHCHGGPGVEPAAWSRGMLPRPPQLSEAASEWEPDEVVWIIRHGVKFAGMPAFGETHDNEGLWNIAAFVKDLPAMTPADYRGHDGHDGPDGHEH